MRSCQTLKLSPESCSFSPSGGVSSFLHCTAYGGKNVQQWCSDQYGNYEKGQATDPTGAATGDLRVLRGGSWGNIPRRCRSARRGRYDPDGRFVYFGFRVVVAVGVDLH